MLPNLKSYPLTPAQVNADKALTDGVPKSTDLDCPVCYKTCPEVSEPTVCCTSCGHHAHNVCFNVRAKALDG